MRAHLLALCFAAGCALGATASAQNAPYQRQARDIYRQIIGYRSSQGHGQVPAEADFIATALRAGGVPADNITIVPHGETAFMLVRIPGSQHDAPILFSAHMDVVDARPEDWQRNPYALTEENGMFFGRGSLDNKAGDVALISTILRITAAHHQPRHTLVFAFVGDEETAEETTEAIAHHPWVHGARFAINTDAGGGILGPDGRPVLYTVQASEKTFASFHLTVTNPGGHSSRPRADNAIYQLAHALLRVEAYHFPTQMDAITHNYFETLGRITPDEVGQAMTAFAANPHDEHAADVLAAHPEYIGLTRTTCVATMLDAGHAENALPQRATATVNCRIFPGTSVDSVQQTLTQVVADPQVHFDVMPPPPMESAISVPTAEVSAAIERSIHRAHPGVPITTAMEAGATDGRHYRAVGIPTYGTSGLFIRPSDMFAHGLNERLPVASFYEGLDHIYDLAADFGG